MEVQIPPIDPVIDPAIEIAKKRKELTSAMMKAQDAMLTNEDPEKIQSLFISYKVHKDALLMFEDSLLTPEQKMAQERYDAARLKLVELQKLEDEAWELLIKVMPNAVRKGAAKVSSGQRESRATVSMTTELKAKIIQMAKEGKRNIDIQKATGLNNGQVSPILQKAGLTKPRNKG